jgi:hypothetical protein
MNDYRKDKERNPSLLVGAAVIEPAETKIVITRDSGHSPEVESETMAVEGRVNTVVVRADVHREA